MTIKILTACAALALVGCASDKGGTDTDADRTYGTGSQIQTNGSNISTNGNNVSTNGPATNAVPHQGLGAEQQTAPQTPQNPENRPL